ncbi:hypothetical protein CCE28_00875 [Anaeromicrobium sediminis]|uniref:Metallo-beta-lactamase domain-containing protein n=2 Tax=Anaeromicrobium sediminis TaxID=1478221 RepID=A0A267MQ37_9FIRM|nr:hypothetical protein CCE28_00875 [Anaeromicrobium sediminis]
MIATHPHEDHIGGLDNILNAFSVEQIIDSRDIHTSKTYTEYINAVAIEKKNGAKCFLDTDATFDLANGINFKVIELGDGYKNTNNNSVVAMLDYNNAEILFTGDLESDVEIPNLAKFTDIELFKVGHPGSRTATSQEFYTKRF